jgi:AAA domain-containing protein
VSSEATPVERHAYLNRLALRLAITDADLDEAKFRDTEARKAAEADFAAARNNGLPQVRPVLADGTELGLVSLIGGGQTVTVDEDELMLHVALTDPGEIEEYALPAALADPQVVALLAERFPGYTRRRVSAQARKQLQKVLEENDGHVFNTLTGERVKVATIERHKATGKCSYKPGKDAARAIRAALAAGTLTRDGEIVTPAPATQPAPAPQPARPAAAPVPGKPAHAPTPEQRAVIDAFAAGDSVVVEAGAGAGKTSTLAMAAATTPARHGLYVAYNKAIATDAKGAFPGNVHCSTAHALAMASHGRQFQRRLNGARIPAREQAMILGINEPAKVGAKLLAPAKVARLAVETVLRFCRSADDELADWHVPWNQPGLDDRAVRPQLTAAVLPAALRAWADLTSTDGRLRFDHAIYLKLWQLSRPRLDADFILFDEAQDANGVILSVVTSQEHAQLVAVGDQAQAINGWNGAVDAMDKFPGSKRLALTQSFRFGPAVAREANKWLALLGSPLRLRGFDRISSMVAPLEWPDAILCRTNAGTMVQAMRILEAGKSVAITGGGKDIASLAEAAVELKAGRGTGHPELFAFQTWAEVQDHAENDPSGSDLKVLVDLIDEHGPEKIIAMCSRLTDERQAEVTVSTAHKSKGREWNSVKISSDFRKPGGDPDDPPEVPDDLAMLAYVAVTRGRLTLDRGGLAWIDDLAPAKAVA